MAKEDKEYVEKQGSCLGIAAGRHAVAAPIQGEYSKFTVILVY